MCYTHSPWMESVQYDESVYHIWMSTPPCVTCRKITDSSSRSRYSGGERLTKVGGGLDRSNCEETSDRSVNRLSFESATCAQGSSTMTRMRIQVYNITYSSGSVNDWSGLLWPVHCHVRCLRCQLSSLCRISDTCIGLSLHWCFMPFALLSLR
jgi:hypothetical protein